MARREALECQTPVGERFCKKTTVYGVQYLDLCKGDRFDEDKNQESQ